jgi:exopolysaccharide biosynthesis polyprenyl glycosylphosphotransferase
MLRNLSPGYLLTLLVADALIITAGLLGAWYLRLHVQIGAYAPEGALVPPVWMFAAAVSLWIFALGQAGVYQPQTDAISALRRLLIGHGLGALLLLGLIYVAYRDFSRLQAFYVVALTGGGLLLHRGLLWYLADSSSEKRRVLIVGVDDHAQRVGQTVQAHEWARLALVGYLQPNGQPPADGIAARICGTLADLETVVEREAVDEVVIAARWFDDAVFDDVARVARALQQQAVNIRIAPDYADLAYFHLSAEDFGGIPLIGVRYAILSPGQRLVKRLLDVLIALLVLLLSWPLFLLIALAIRLDSRGPAIFGQQRVGQYGRRFTMLKFRTMHITQPVRIIAKQRHDPRVTQVGRWLRRTSLDELPQFINVLRGQMSVVGPRPEMPEYVEKYEWWQRKRFEVPQGITGWWQINGRADRPMFENIEDDLYYIRHYSLWLDLQIMLRTVWVVLTGRGAY